MFSFKSTLEPLPTRSMLLPTFVFVPACRGTLRFSSIMTYCFSQVLSVSPEGFFVFSFGQPQPSLFQYDETKFPRSHSSSFFCCKIGYLKRAPTYGDTIFPPGRHSFHISFARMSIFPGPKPSTLPPVNLSCNVLPRQRPRPTFFFCFENSLFLLLVVVF